MAYIFKKKEEVVEYLTQLEFTIGEDYNHYIVPHHSYTTRFDIFYNSENVGYVENEELTPNANSEWVIHIPTDKRAYLESKNKGLVGAIFDLPTNQDGNIDKKYYIEPVAFTRIIGKDYKNTSHQIDAKGPGSYVGLKFDNEFWNVEDTEVASGSKQLNISIDLKKFANVLKYSLAEVSGVMPSGVVTDPQGISVRTCDTYPSIIVAESSNTRPVWKDLKDITVGYAANATNADMFGFKKPEDFVTYTNINSDITSYFDNSYNYGFRTGYDVEKNESYVYTRAYRVHLVGDVSGDAEVSNFGDIDIETKIADPSKLVFIKNVEDGTEFHSGVSINGPVHLKYGNDGPYSKPTTIYDPVGEVVYSQVIGYMADTDMWRMGAGSTDISKGFLEIATTDSVNDYPTSSPIYVAQYVGQNFDYIIRRATLLDSNGNTSFPGTVSSKGLNVDGIQISKDEIGNAIFNISGDRKYKFNINDSTIFELTPGGVVLNTNYAPLDSPNFIGVPTAPTAGVSTDSTQVATTAYVKSVVPISVGSNVTPVYTNADGVITASDATVGSSTTPVYLKNGVITSTGKSFSNYAPKASPEFTGTPTAPTATAGTNSTQIATTAYVDTAVSNLVNGAPEQLDTLKEIADALSDNTEIANALTVSIASKLNKDSGDYIKSISINGKTITLTKGNGEQEELTTKDTTYSNATVNRSGLMSAEDKTKLDSVSNYIDNFTLPIASADTLGGIKVGNNLSIDSEGVLSAGSLEYSVATLERDGLMSAYDKLKVFLLPENEGFEGQILRWDGEEGRAVWSEEKKLEDLDDSIIDTLNTLSEALRENSAVVDAINSMNASFAKSLVANENKYLFLKDGNNNTLSTVNVFDLVDVHFVSAMGPKPDAKNYYNDGATSYGALAIGIGAEGKAINSYAIGTGTQVLGTDSFAAGERAIVTGKSSIAVGKGAVATGGDLNSESIRSLLATNEETLARLDSLRQAVSDREAEVNAAQIQFDYNNLAYERVNRAQAQIDAYNEEITNTLQPAADEANRIYQEKTDAYNTLYQQFEDHIRVVEILPFDQYTNTSTGEFDLSRMAADLKAHTEEGTDFDYDLTFYETYITNYIKATGDLRQNIITANSLQYAYESGDSIWNDSLRNYTSITPAQASVIGITLNKTYKVNPLATVIYVLRSSEGITYGNRKSQNISINSLIERLSLTSITLPSINVDINIIDDESYNATLTTLDTWYSNHKNLNDFLVGVDFYQYLPSTVLDQDEFTEKMNFAQQNFDIFVQHLYNTYKSGITVEHEQYLYEKYVAEDNMAEALIHLQNKATEKTYWDDNKNYVAYPEFDNMFSIWPYGRTIAKRVVNLSAQWKKENVTDVQDSVNVALSTIRQELTGLLSEAQVEMEQAGRNATAANNALNQKRQQASALEPSAEDRAAAARQAQSLTTLNNLKAQYQQDMQALDSARETLELTDLTNIGENAFALGTSALISGKNAIGLGTDVIVTGDNSIGIGKNNVIDSLNSSVVGTNSTLSSTANNTSILGSNITTTAQNAVILGDRSVGEDNAVSVGSENSRRKIVNVANGTRATDVATVGQTATIEVGEGLVITTGTNSDGSIKYTISLANP